MSVLSNIITSISIGISVSLFVHYLTKTIYQNRWKKEEKYQQKNIEKLLIYSTMPKFFLKAKKNEEEIIQVLQYYCMNTNNLNSGRRNIDRVRRALNSSEGKIAADMALNYLKERLNNKECA